MKPSYFKPILLSGAIATLLGVPTLQAGERSAVAYQPIPAGYMPYRAPAGLGAPVRHLPRFELPFAPQGIERPAMPEMPEWVKESRARNQQPPRFESPFGPEGMGRPARP
ncbi:MAG: hypothetical protein KDI68_14290, partial [Gammaproteobacteria bacterium]|nr:hypothetical protein [Gammaproteobacteria bacterium]